MTLPLKPRRGGFLRPFGCGEFVRDFLLGLQPHGSIKVNPGTGAPQSTICREYKLALMRFTATDLAARKEETAARKQNRKIKPENIEKLAEELLERIPYKTTACRYNSFKTYFSDLKKLKWVAYTGHLEPSQFQRRYIKGEPRKFFRLTEAGKKASPTAWKNPHRTLYETKP